MDETLWFEKQISSMADDLWYIKQQSRTLQEYRQDIRRQWDDEASRELNLRYLNPHEEDDGEMLQFLEKQHVTLNQVEDKINTTFKLAIDIEQLSIEIAELLEFVKEDIHRAHSNYAVYKDNLSLAEAEFPVVQDFINAANSACG